MAKKRRKKVISVGGIKEVENIATRKGIIIQPTFDENIDYGISKTEGNYSK